MNSIKALVPIVISMTFIAGSAEAAPAIYNINTNAAPDAMVTATYSHNTQCSPPACYGYYITEFPSMNDAGVVVGRLPLSAYVPPAAPIYEPSPVGSAGIASTWENGVVRILPFPASFKSSAPNDYQIFYSGSLAGSRIYEHRGCRDYNFDNVSDSSRCGSRALAINNSGIVAGTSSYWPAMDTSYFERSHVWGAPGYFTQYPMPWVSPLWTKATPYPFRARFASAQQDNVTGINVAGSMVGSGISSLSYELHGFYSIADGSYGVIGELYQRSTAHAINDNDHAITGAAQYEPSGTYSYNSASPMAAYVFKNGAFSKWAGQLPGGLLSEGYDINNSEVVVGRAINAADQIRAFSWDGKVNGGIKDLGTLGGTFSVARSVNDSGVIVGSSTNDAEDYRAFVYLPLEGKMYDLNSYLASPQPGWSIVDAYTVNAKGQILVRAENSTSGARAYWVLSINGFDQGPSITSAEFISPNSTTNASVDSAGDNDYFKVVLAENGTFNLGTTGTTDIFCHLYNSANTEIATHNDNSITNGNCTIRHRLAAGTYYIRTRHYSSTGTGGYQLLTGFLAEDGNNKENATTIPVVSTTAAAIDTAGDVDYFTIYLNAAKTVTVKTPGGAITSMYCALQSTDGSLMTDISNNAGENVSCSRTYSVTSPGIYYIKVKHSNINWRGTYHLVLQ